MGRVLFLGGSPCSGKSTLAEALARDLKIAYFKVDDFLEAFMAEGARRGLPLCEKLLTMSADTIWMRDPAEQCQEEFDLYTEYAPMIREKLSAMEGLVITEGAAYHPALMQAWGVQDRDYLALVPTKDFQISRYRQRPWVSMVLKDCRNPEAAFAHWMERDALYAGQVAERCEALGYACLWQDGSLSPETLTEKAKAHFEI